MKMIMKSLLKTGMFPKTLNPIMTGTGRSRRQINYSDDTFNEIVEDIMSKLREEDIKYILSISSFDFKAFVYGARNVRNVYGTDDPHDHPDNVSVNIIKEVYKRVHDQTNNIK